MTLSVCAWSRRGTCRTGNDSGSRHYLGGPFEDRTGGLITFDANDTAAEGAVLEDPFVREDLVEARWLKQWTLE